MKMTKDLAKRWALLVSKLHADGKHEIAADIVGTFMLGSRLTSASEIKQYDLMNGDVPVLEELHEMLDELGYENIVKMGEKRRKELERGPPGINVPMQYGTL